MASLQPRTGTILEDLEAMLASAAIPPRIARSGEQLLERLRRPVRVGLIGFETAQRRHLLTALLGTDLVPEQSIWPTIEIGFAAQPQTSATLADGSTFTADGLPQADLLARGAVFLRIGAPLDVLRRVTLLYLAAAEEAAEQSAALRWAARHIDFALWCTRSFAPAEARIWAAAPPALKNHAYLVAFASEAEARDLRARTPADFERVIGLPDMSAGARTLFAQLAADIDDALGEDLDAARLLLHHCGQRVDTPHARPAPDAAPAPVETRPARPAEAVRHDLPHTALLSEPLLFLRRQARDLFEALEWQDRTSPDWAGEVLERCCEVTDGLRDRAADWPEDETPVRSLRCLVDEAADMATLLQIEGGAAQAEDAAALLLQLRSAFEATLTPAAAPVN